MQALDNEMAPILSDFFVFLIKCFTKSSRDQETSEIAMGSWFGCLKPIKVSLKAYFVSVLSKIWIRNETNLKSYATRCANKSTYIQSLDILCKYTDLLLHPLFGLNKRSSCSNCHL